MFDYCTIKGEICPYCTLSRGSLYCGIARGENNIRYMASCPLEAKEKKKGGLYYAKKESKKKRYHKEKIDQAEEYGEVDAGGGSHDGEKGNEGTIY